MEYVIYYSKGLAGVLFELKCKYEKERHSQSPRTLTVTTHNHGQSHTIQNHPNSHIIQAHTGILVGKIDSFMGQKTRLALFRARSDVKSKKLTKPKVGISFVKNYLNCVLCEHKNWTDLDMHGLEKDFFQQQRW
jgi:hypothetical protein